MALNGNLLEKTVKVGLNVWKGFKTMSSAPKTPRIMKAIGTHNGVFHCDEALACFMLKQLPEYADAEIKRTRDQAILDACDIVVDVGAVYDHEKKRYDHHQRSFNQTLSTVLPDVAKNKHIKLSSAGLVYAHYGKDVISTIMEKKDHALSTDVIDVIFIALYDGLIEELDALDNGVPMYGGEPKYRINTHLGARVSKLNPSWNSTVKNDSDNLFYKAMELAGAEFTDKLVELVTVWWPARFIVKNAIKTRLITHESGAVIQLSDPCPWKEHLLQLEEELGMSNQIKFVIYPDSNGSWRVQGIPVQPDSFICRVFLHKDWMGLRDKQLSEVSNIPGCIFCHGNGFIGGNATKEGALLMATRSIKNETFADLI
ncbi:PREDICTED: UPF0160 protein [Nicrophorus vespilloides]|uniref:UPF0160 protein n=1 Tax=Nicrophorus vespilloides TaxID=110193 RepID=A0ABM1MXH9_NICVS|nr:PREDICTED: UPF0160 protein [Nicrophorus vespilloides]